MTPITLTASLCGNKLRAQAASPHGPLVGLDQHASRTPDLAGKPGPIGDAGQSKPDSDPCPSCPASAREIGRFPTSGHDGALTWDRGAATIRPTSRVRRDGASAVANHSTLCGREWGIDQPRRRRSNRPGISQAPGTAKAMTVWKANARTRAFHRRGRRGTFPRNLSGPHDRQGSRDPRSGAPANPV
jgi:hypothetical protein